MIIWRCDKYLSFHRQYVEKYFTSCRIDSRFNVVDVAAELRAGRPKQRGSMSGRSKRLYFHQNVQIGSEAHPASYSVGTGGSFPGCKTVGAWSWKLTSN